MTYLDSRFLKMLAILAVMLLAQPAFGITIILKNNDTPIRGFLVSEDARQIQVRVAQPDGTFTEKTISKADIDLVHRPVDTERLAALSPDDPKKYRDYAEELAVKRIDPEAREMGVRLYAIAAHLDPANLGRSSLLGMTALAASADEERRYRALAYLLDPEHDRSVLKEVVSSNKARAAEATSDIAATAQTLGALRAIEMLRKGRTTEAAKQLRREGIEDALRPYADIITFEQLLDECRSRVSRGPAASPELAARLLRVELRLLNEPLTLDESARSSDAWSQLKASALTKTARPLTIDTITPYDPKQCVYREGKWVAPE